jgi:hypothetical protein
MEIFLTKYKTTVYHIRIIPMPRSSDRDQRVLIITIIINDAWHTNPRIIDVVKVSPKVTNSSNEGIIRLN